MARSNTTYGAYDISLKEEIERIIDKLKEIGIRNPTKMEASALIAEKNRKAKMNVLEVKEFFSKLRGIK
jgi:hypothetical protein